MATKSSAASGEDIRLATRVCRDTVWQSAERPVPLPTLDCKVCGRPALHFGEFIAACEAVAQGLQMWGGYPASDPLRFYSVPVYDYRCCPRNTLGPDWVTVGDVTVHHNADKCKITRDGNEVFVQLWIDREAP